MSESISPDVQSAVERAVGHQFKDPAILAQALRHASICENRLESNERLEFLGDSVLGLIVSRRIFDRRPDLLEGEMTKIKSTVVSRTTCAAISRSLGLNKLVVTGKGMQSQLETPQSLAAAVLESVIAAVYLDGGQAAAEQFLLPIVDPLIDKAADSGHQENYKSVLQQHCQQSLGSTPAYRVLDEKGPDHSKCFKVCVEVAGRKFESVWAPSKKQAEQQAALAALRELKLVEELGDGSVRITPTSLASTAE